MFVGFSLTTMHQLLSCF